MPLTHFSKATFSSSLFCHPTHVLSLLLSILSLWHLNLELGFILTFPQICICPYWTCVFTQTNAKGIYLLTLWIRLKSILKYRPFFWGWFSVSVAYYGLTSVPLDLYSASQHAADKEIVSSVYLGKQWPFKYFFICYFAPHFHLAWVRFPLYIRYYITYDITFFSAGSSILSLIIGTLK